MVAGAVLVAMELGPVGVWVGGIATFCAVLVALLS
jgi:hypothetical protein